MRTTLRGWLSRHWRHAMMVWYAAAVGLGLAAIATLPWSVHWYLILAPFPLGCGIGLASVAILDHIFALRREKFEGRLPQAIHKLDRESEDDPVVFVVTRRNGEMATVEAPPNYHPSQDNGRFVIELLIGPEMMAKIDKITFGEVNEE